MNNIELQTATPDTGLVIRVPTAFIRRDPKQPRVYFDPDAMNELRDSIKSIGQVLPALIKKIENPEGLEKYEIIDGERRWLACKMAGVPYLIAIVSEAKDKDDQFVRSVVANLCRESHTVLEISAAVKRLQDMGKTLEEISKICGKSITWVNQYLSINKLCPEVLAMLRPEIPEESRLPFTTALLLVKLTFQYQIELAKAITENHLTQFQAKNLIARTVCQKNGDSLVHNPRKKFDVIFGHTNRARNWAKTLLEMDRELLLEILRGGNLQKRIKLLEIAKDAKSQFAELESYLSKNLFPQKIPVKKK